MPAKIKALAPLLLVILGALSLGWAALVNGQPFFHPDSLGYVRGPDVAVARLLGPRYASPWARLDPAAAVATADTRAARQAPADKPTKEVLGGRSIYYGVLADLGAHAGGFWLTVLVQALAVAWLARVTLGALGLYRPGAYVAVLALLGLATPAPFFIGFVMPDIWAGLSIGALSLAFAAPDRLSRVEIALLAMLIAFAALAHASVVPVLAVLMGAGAALSRIHRASARPVLGLALGGLALIAAALGGLAFTALVKHTAGAPPLNPPFLTARLIGDGPGTRFIRSGCGGQAFVVCRYGAPLPLDADHVLWGRTRQDGLFQIATPADRRAISDEQGRFALAVLKAYPQEEAVAALRNIAAQLACTDLSDFNYKPSVAESFRLTLPAQTLAVMARTRAKAQAWPVTRLQAGQAIMLGALGLAAAILALRPRAGADTAWPQAARPASLRLLILAGVGLVANAAVCGALSEVAGRYQARVVWVLTLALAVWILARLSPIRLRPGDRA